MIMLRVRRELLWLFCLLIFNVSGQPLKCRVGWGGQERIIPTERINDDYCDCPFDGMDEPNTEACAGSVGWTGIAGKARDDVSLPVYQCPQQPKLQISLSRINDGICDCCDGSDEKSGLCPDICDQVLAEERAARAKAEKNFATGHQKRQELLAEFQILRQETLKEIGVKQEELEKVEIDKQQVQREMGEAKREFMNERLKLVEQVRESMNDLVNPLSQDELIAFIVQTCQLAGELDGADNASTCVPLRLAGMDMGFVWEDEDLGSSIVLFRSLLREKDGWETIADLMDKHARGQRLEWSRKQQETPKAPALQQRHHREDHDDEDDDDDDYVRDFDDEYHDDAIYGDDDMAYHRRDSHADENKAKVNDDILDEIRKSHLSKFRIRFLQNAVDVIRKIDDLSNHEDDDDDDVHADEEGATEDGEVNDGGSVFDPAALQMAKNTLQRRKERIERGFDYAASGLVLTRALVARAGVEPDDLRRWLANLLIGTVLHGNIGSHELWQLVVMNVPEFEYKVSDIEESCTFGACMAEESAAFNDHFAGICPPRIIESRGDSFPPTPIVDAAHVLCNDLSAEPPTWVCTSITPDEPPSDIPDGFCGYFEVHPRDTADSLSEKFAPLSSLGASQKISELNEKIRNVEETHRNVERELDELYDRIGGKKQDKFGTDGELHSLSEECPSIVAGKYIYEVCLFGKASQKDRDDEHDRGTDLGRWKGMTIDSETGERVMTWSGGAKCWNGPQRSATVHVTCGVETRVLSAEEPDTCRYVLEMETPIGCDEEFKKQFGL